MSNKKIKENGNLIESFAYAIRGLVYVIKSERNMRIHMVTAILVIIISLFLNLTRFELIAVIFAITLVLITEMLNTASERMINLITEKRHPLAKIIKDMTAGAVLFSSMCAVVVGYLVFIKQEVLAVFDKSIVIKKISTFPPYIAAIAVFLVLVLSFFVKGLKRKNPSIVGGMPSIHTAIAFSLACIAYFISSNIYVLFISLFLAAMVGQTRVSINIRNIWAVITGAVLGTSVTILIFQIVV